MGKITGVTWCHHSFNTHWGCLEVAPECDNCYASTLAVDRYKVKIDGMPIWGSPVETPRRTFGDKHWDEPHKWNAQALREGKRHRVFCASMGDIFEQHPTVEALRPRFWQLIAETPWLDWQLLTKRPHMIAKMVPHEWVTEYRWPANVWIGTSAGTQRSADKFLPHLVRLPAPIKFVSVEPLLEPVDLSPWIADLQWVIVGAESGSGARPMQDDWVRVLRDACQENGVSFFFKQRVVGGRKVEHPELDGRIYEEFPVPVV